MKSAAQIECACVVGSIIGEGDQKLTNIVKSCGFNIGMAAQIANDILGITRKNDIEKRKITLPIVFALQYTDEEIRHELETIFFESGKGKPPVNTRKISELLFQSGAIEYAAVKMEFYKQRALESLKKLKTKGVMVDNLNTFVE